MAGMRFVMNAGRTSKQGQQINVGKDHDDYQATVSTLTMHPEDLKALGIAAGGTVRVRSEYGGEATFGCQEGKVPRGMIFVPYGPPTCRLMGSETGFQCAALGCHTRISPLPGTDVSPV